MKATILIEDGATQVVLTPETPWDRAVVSAFEEGDQRIFVKRGEFYKCQGGWTREGGSNECLIIRIDFRDKDEHGLKVAENLVP